MRLIDADLLKQATKAPDTNGLTVFIEKVLCGLIDRQPTVDDVPVVRCEKCIFFKEVTINGVSLGKGFCDIDGRSHKCDWFCADGRRNDGQGI